jgi:UDP-N-acetylmuramate--alanine ligase
MFFKPQPVHFVGIGGIGMSGLAEILLGMGYRVSGSDLRSSSVTEGLEQRGAKVFQGHQAANLGDARAVVVSSAVAQDNPEIAEARRLGIPVIPRGELLAELMRLKFGIAVAGSHGKTTTTSMIAAIMTHAGLDPTVVVGGRVGMMGGANARLGKSDYLVVESDESDGSFLKLAPIVAVVTNIDREHLDHYAGLDEIRQAFAAFVGKLPFYGAAVLCLDDENIQRILPSVNRRAITYGTSAQADLRVTHSAAGHMASQFQLTYRGDDLGCFRLHVPGAHNALNAAAAAAVGLELEIPVDQIREALERFTGVERRFQIRGSEGGVTVIDDYGHHPTEIQATLAAARACRFRRVHVLFQPHRYTRTQALLDDFARAFHQADSVFVLDIYGASEKPIEGVSSRALVERIRAFGHRDAHYAGATKQGAMDSGIAAVIEAAREGDAIITLGAGSISQAGGAILDQLRGRA